MSKMQELYKKVAGDLTLQEKVSSILKEGESAGPVATEEKLMAFAKDLGYDIRLEEMGSFFDGMYTQAQGELSNTELDQVAGGKSVDGSLAIVESVLTLGIACAITSVAATINQWACSSAFE